MSNIVLKFNAGLPKDDPSTFNELYTLIDSISTSVSITLASNKVAAIRKFTKISSISEDVDSYVFDAYSNNSSTIISIPKDYPNLGTNQSTWHRITDLMLQHCMGITPNVTDILISDFKNHLLAIEHSTNDTSDLFYEYDKAVANVKIMIFPSAKINAKRPQEILKNMTSSIRNEAFNVVQQRLMDHITNHCR